MAKIKDIFGNGGAEATSSPKGSMEWHGQQQADADTPQTESPTPPKGTRERTEQNTGENAPETAPAPSAAPQTDLTAALLKATPQVTDIKNTPIRISYEDMFRLLNPYQPPTREELEKERKKQKRERIFAAVGDGISALSNLYFTTQYAPNMYKPAETQSEKTKKRWDKLAAERNSNMTAYINGLMRARQADDAYNDNERAWARQTGLDKAEAERYKAKAETDQANADREYNFRVQTQKDETERGKERDAETARHNKAMEEIGRKNAETSAAKAANSASGSGRGGKGSGYTREQKQSAWNEWWRYTDEQRKDWRKRFGNRKDTPDSDDFVVAVKEMHDDYIAKKKGGKKSISGFGGKQQTTGKKSIKGFGGN